MRLLCVALAALLLGGCVRRQIDITSVPDGALVRVNDREVGRTPCRIEFDHYGVYEVRLTLPGYESVVGMGRADAPFWDWAGIDLVGELIPANFVSSTRWEFHLIPASSDPDALVQRAEALRSDLHAIEVERPVQVVRPAAEAPDVTARRAAERGQVPTPPSVLESPVPPSGPDPSAPSPSFPGRPD